MRRKGWTAVKKMVCTAAVLGLLLMNAAALPELGALHAKSAALYAANGQELYVSNADEKLQPASVTKIMTMLLVVALYLGNEVVDGLSESDNISQMTHIVGGLCGIVFGFTLARAKKR